MSFILLCLQAAIIVGAAIAGAPASASASASGARMDPTGHGAVEIKQCGTNLCGGVVW